MKYFANLIMLIGPKRPLNLQSWKDGFRANNPKTYDKKWKKENPEKISKSNKKYKKTNSSAMYALKAKRRARKLNQTSINANQKIICWFYEISRQMSKRMGVIGYYHVDHIIPLSKNGPHHEDNLQILTAHQNQTKRNKIISQNEATP